MNRGRILLLLGILGIITLFPFIQAATTGTTVFTFRVPTTKSISVTYGGSCSATAFFYNEIDANVDPDADGNAIKVKPNSARTDPKQTIVLDKNFVGVNNPSGGDVAYGGTTTGVPPSNNTSPSTELTNGEYDGIEADDTSYDESNVVTDNRFPSHRFVFKTNVNPQLIYDLNVFFMGDAVQSGIDCSAGAGSIRDINTYIWNYTTGSYSLLSSDLGSGSESGVNPRTLTNQISTDINDYVSWDGNITILARGEEIVGFNVETCFFTDFINLKITYHPTPTTFCQSSTLSPLTLTNSGNTTVNVDGNFASAFTGNDVNVVLKVWMGDGTGCGADGNGLGGWEKDCSVTGTTNPVTSTTCKNYNQFNATIGSRLVTNLAAGDTNQLCFSGDFNSVALAGDHNQNFQAGVKYS